MTVVDDLDQAIEKWRLATREFIRGNPGPAQESFSHRTDVTLANPLGPASPEIGPVAHGREQVALTQEQAASRVIPFVLLFAIWEFYGFDITGPANRD